MEMKNESEIVEIIDILEQIKKLNSMIGLHQQQSPNDFMIHQYQDLKTRFLEELNQKLQPFEIEVKNSIKAA